MATGQNIADEARADLNDGDSGNYRWSDATILRYINAAQRQIVQLLPEANVVEEVVTLSRGVRQELPAAAVKFLALYNVATSGETQIRGPAVTVVEEDALNSSLPAWPGDSFAPSEDGVIDHVVHDPRDPTSFGVYPAPTADDVDAFVKYAALPTALAALSENFGLRDEFLNAAVAYTKFRMLTMDGRYGSEPGVRLELWNNFRTTLGLKPDIDRRVDPARGRAGGDSNG